MKDLKEIIDSFAKKVELDDYAIVSKEDLQVALKALKIYQNYCDRGVTSTIPSTKVSLNCDDYCSTIR